MLKFRFRFAAKAASSLSDQLIFSGANFVLNVSLASSISRNDYGIFALVYSLVVLISVVHSSLIGEPITVLWAQNSEDKALYMRRCFYFNAIFIGVSLALLGLIYGILQYDGIYFAVYTVILTSFSLMWLFRYFSYAESRPQTGMIQSAIYAVTLIGFVAAMRATDQLTGFTALCGLAAAGIAGAGYGAIIHKVQLRGVGRHDLPAIVALAHYGKWSAPSGIANWAAANILLVTMPIFGSAAESGQLKAFLNVLLPFQQVLQGASQIALPVLARDITLGNTRRVKRLQILFVAASVIGSLVMVAALFLFGPEIYAVLYGRSYQVNPELLLYGAAIPISMAAIAALRTILRAHQRPRSVLLAYGFGLGIAGVIGVPLASVGNAATGALAMSAIHIVIFLSLAISIVRMARTRFSGEEEALT